MFAVLVAGCASQTTETLEPAHVVTVFLETDTSQDHEYNISVHQNGELVQAETGEAMADFSFRTVVMSPSVEGADAIVEVQENGILLASRTVHPQACSSGEVAVTITAADETVSIKDECN